MKNKKQTHRRPSVMVARPINGITINGDEYLLDDRGQPLKFPSIPVAKKFLREKGVRHFTGLRFPLVKESK